MNTYLIKLFEKYNISDKNRYEILQIFSLLPNIKQINLLNNFETLALKLKKIEDEINIEKEVLVWKAVERVWKAILDKRKDKNSFVRKESEILKKEILF